MVVGKVESNHSAFRCGDTPFDRRVELFSGSLTFTHEGTLHVLTASRTTNTRQRHTLVLVLAGLPVGGGGESLVADTQVGSYEVLAEGVFSADRGVSTFVNIHTAAAQRCLVTRFTGSEAAVRTNRVLASL